MALGYLRVLAAGAALVAAGSSTVQAQDQRADAAAPQAAVQPNCPMGVTGANAERMMPHGTQTQQMMRHDAQVQEMMQAMQQMRSDMQAMREQMTQMHQQMQGRR